MKPNIEIVNGKFRTTAAIKCGSLLLHPGWPLGFAARDIEVDKIIEFSSHKNTEDVLLKAENANAS